MSNDPEQSAEEVAERLVAAWTIQQENAPLIAAALQSEREKTRWNENHVEHLISTILTLRTQLLNLLAIIHADGGHYTGKHGEAKSCEDAAAKWYQMVSELETLRAQNAELVKEVEKLRLLEMPSR